MHTKSMVVGAVLGWVSMIAGLQVAKADCFQDAWPSVGAEKHGLVVADNGDEAVVLSCGFADAVDVAVERCDYFVQGLLEDGYPEEQLGGASGVWEACVRLETPVGPLPAAQHYDTTDGTFWKVAGAL
jgi:hypothetical protein